MCMGESKQTLCNWQGDGVSTAYGCSCRTGRSAGSAAVDTTALCPAVRGPVYTLQIAFTERWRRIPDYPDIAEARYSVRDSTDWHSSCKLELHCSLFSNLV